MLRTQGFFSDLLNRIIERKRVRRNRRW